MGAQYHHIMSHNGINNKNTAATTTFVVNKLLMHLILCRLKAMTDDEVLCTNARYYHIASRNCNNNNDTAATTTFVVNKPLVRRHTSFILQHIALCNGNNNKATTGTTNN
jgi:hypothetical protein